MSRRPDENGNAGNITSRKEYARTYGEKGELLDTVVYTYGDSEWGDLLTAYDGKPITYDGIGNILTYDGWTFNWEHGRELSSMSNGTTTWTYTYDANGMRTSRTNGTTTYNYIYNGSQLVQMTVGNNTLHFTYDASGAPVVVDWNGTLYYYVTSFQGDVQVIMNLAGEVVVQYVYDAWGNIVATDGELATTLGELNPLRYRGYVFDQDTGLYYLQSRYYNPEWGRFINADVFVSTGQGILGNNMFAYCGNNPVTRKDSTGTVYVFLDEFMTDVDLDGRYDEGGGGGGWGLGINPSYYIAKATQTYDWNWQNSDYNQYPSLPSESANQQTADVEDFDSLIQNPTSIVGKSQSDVADILGDGWTTGKYGTAQKGWKFNNGDKMVAYHPGNGRHGGSYYVLSSSKAGRTKIVGPDYIASPDDKARIIWCS